MEVSLRPGTQRNTKAHVVTVGPHELFFSYQTCIAYRCMPPIGECYTVRIANHWGPTTGRHFREMGVADFKVLSDEEFNATIEAAMSTFKVGG